MTTDSSGACVLLPKPRQFLTKRSLSDLRQVERRIQLGEYRSLELVKGARVGDRYENDTQVGVHPRRQLSLIDDVLARCLGQYGAETAAKGRELVLLAQMHSGDPAPQRV